ncbi:serine protease [Pedobacter nutrimenti]|uniref:S1 family peptidase n=1 Tax=Pedobacter nutrimenti TaxID=1241337 RepID=UPI002930DE86|nr:serine protease [Pedobacter nutrimenti]
MYKSTTLYHLLLITFCFSCSFAFAQNSEKVNYVNENQFRKQLIEKAEYLLKTKQHKSFAQIEEEALQLKENTQSSEKVNLTKPTANKKLEGNVLFNSCKPGVLSIGRSYKCGGCDLTHTVMWASAFAISEDGVCVTNYHVLHDYITKDDSTKDKDNFYFVGTSDGHVYPVEKILAYSKDGDAAIFKVNTTGNKLKTLQLGEPAETGSAVRAITNPTDILYYYTEGVVSGNIQEGGEYSKRMKITADYAAGSSGAPILNQYGQVIGMVCTTSDVYYEPAKEKWLQMIVKYTIPVCTIKSLINSKS